MEYVYTFESFITKLNEGLIKSYDINKTTQDIDRLLKSHNLKYSISIINNNTFEISIDDLDRIKYLKLTIDDILIRLFNLYGWFPSFYTPSMIGTKIRCSPIYLCPGCK